MKAIINCDIILEYGIIRDGAVLIEGEKIFAVGKRSELKIPADAEIIDAEGTYVGPGFVDIHVHAGGAYTTYGEPREAAEHFLRHGETSILATPSYSLNFAESIEAIRSARAALGKVKTLRGIYMEGPYINPDYGAFSHLNPWRAPIDEGEFRALVDECGTDVKVWTVAPEREGLLPFLQYAREVNPDVVFSLGHSEATPSEVRALGKYRPTLITHIFDATGQLPVEGGTRGVGPDEYALCEKEMYCELISDSIAIHVKPELQRILLLCKGIDRIVLVTDSTKISEFSPKGGDTPDLNFDDLGGLAGSLMTMDMATRNFMTHTGVGLSEAFIAASRNPARVIGLDSEIGTVEAGKYADLVFVDDKINVKKVILRGEMQNFVN